MRPNRKLGLQLNIKKNSKYLRMNTYCTCSPLYFPLKSPRKYAQTNQTNVTGIDEKRLCKIVMLMEKHMLSIKLSLQLNLK